MVDGRESQVDGQVDNGVVPVQFLQGFGDHQAVSAHEESGGDMDFIVGVVVDHFDEVVLVRFGYVCDYDREDSRLFCYLGLPFKRAVPGNTKFLLLLSFHCPLYCLFSTFTSAYTFFHFCFNYFLTFLLCAFVSLFYILTSSQFYITLCISKINLPSLYKSDVAFNII